MAILELKNISKTYHTGEESTNVLKKLDLSISEGEFVGLIGPSGSGKSTLLAIASGFDQPDTGEVIVAGTSIYSLSKMERIEFMRKQVGFVFQNFMLFPTLTALENIEFPLIIRNEKPSHARERAYAYLEKVGLKGFENRYPTQLSGGQQQRVGVARALVSEPSILLADEPTANLDTKSATLLFDLFVELNQSKIQDKSLSILISTHDVRFASQIARKIKIQDGELLSE